MFLKLQLFISYWFTILWWSQYQTDQDKKLNFSMSINVHFESSRVSGHKVKCYLDTFLSGFVHKTNNFTRKPPTCCSINVIKFPYRSYGEKSIQLYGQSYSNIYGNSLLEGYNFPIHLLACWLNLINNEYLNEIDTFDCVSLCCCCWCNSL